MNILCGVTGSIAAILLPKMEVAYFDGGKNNVKFIFTDSAMKILDGYDQEKDWYENVKAYTDADEWRYFSEKQSVLHIDLVKWADCLVVSPCTVNTLSKFATGRTDNLLSCCFSAWDFANTRKKCIIAPAANTYMYANKITVNNMQTILSLSHFASVGSWNSDETLTSNTVEFIGAEKKTLYCKDVGEGAMADIGKIKNRIDVFSVFLEKCKEVEDGGLS